MLNEVSTHCVNSVKSTSEACSKTSHHLVVGELMRIACIDKSAADRLRLQELIESAFAECRSAVGHLPLAHCYPASKEEVLLNSAPEAVAVGAAFNVEESLLATRELHFAFPELPILVFLRPESYSLRTLKRFEQLAADIFSTEEAPIRLVHKLSSFQARKKKERGGKLVVVSGVKGGVGTTTVVSGLAHAAQAVGQRAVVLDMSSVAALLHYMAPERKRSAEYAALLVDQLSPELELIERLVVSAPNGVQLLLPPAGGSEIREMWLRDSKRFELTLSVLDLLQELYDLVLVDLANAEGVLTFALLSRAHTRVLVSSNEAASVHLLARSLESLSEIPGDGAILVLLNMLRQKGLDREDVFDFLSLSEFSEKLKSNLQLFPYDAQGADWIGTRNTFYTEASRRAQLILERLANELVGGLQEEADNETPALSWHAFRKWLLGRGKESLSARETVAKTKFLPGPKALLPATESLLLERAAKNNGQKVLSLPRGKVREEETAEALVMQSPSMLYEAPKILGNGEV